MNEHTPIKQRKIWLALPCYGATTTILTMKSIVSDLFYLIGRGDQVKIFDELGHADIYLLRAQIVANFLADEDATDLVMIDNDVGWPQGGLLKLVDHEADVVAGAYPKRELPISFMFRSETTVAAKGSTILGRALTGDAETGLCEVWGVPAGFMSIKRHVLEKMVEHYGPELTCLDAVVPGGKTCRLFDPYWWTDGDGNKRALSEDYAFCQRWRDLGGKIHMDVSIPMAHVGTHAFQGCLGQWLETQPQQEKAA